MKKVSHEKNDQIIVELTDKLIPLTQIAKKLKKPTYYVQNRIKAMNKKNNIKPSHNTSSAANDISESHPLQKSLDAIEKLQKDVEKEIPRITIDANFKFDMGQDFIDAVTNAVFVKIKDRLLK